MRYLILIAAAACFSCNNADDKATANSGNNSQEMLLKSDVDRYPDSAILTENLIQYYRDAANYDNALSIVNKKIGKDSLNPRWWDIKATLHFEDGDTAAAIHSFEKAVSISASPEYIISLGTLYAQTGNAHALDMADGLLNSKAGAEKEAYFIKGLYYSFTNQKERSLPFFDKCLSARYTYMSAYTEKALALYDLHRYTEALAVLDKGLTVQSNYDEGYYYRGMCLEKMGKQLEAIEAYQMALMYDPDYTEAKAALARLGVKN